MANEEVTLVFKAKTTDLERADKALGSVEKRGKGAESSIKKLTGSFKAQRGASQQVAFQLQDIAVQLQGGVSASRTLSQQLPQMFGVFGAGGAILGLFASLASAAFAPFIDGLFNADKATDDLKKTLELLSKTIKITKDDTVVLTEEFERLAKKSSQLAQVELRRRLIDATLASDQAFEKLRNSSKELNFNLGEIQKTAKESAGGFLGVSAKSITATNAISDLAKKLGITKKELLSVSDATRLAFTKRTPETVKALSDQLSRLALGNATPAMVRLASSVNEATKDMEDQTKIIKILQDAQNNLGATLAVSGETSIKLSKETQEQIKKEIELAKTKAQIELTGAMAALEALRASLLTQEEVINERATSRFEIIKRNLDLELITREQAANLTIQTEIKKQDELAKIEEEAAKRKAQQDKQNFNATKSALGTISGLMSSENSKLFKIGQAAAIAQATISGLTAVSNALAVTPYPLGVALAAGAAIVTGANIAKIAAARPPGRAQGGQTRPGETFRVGEFGPETITMGSNGGFVSPGDRPGASNDGVKLDLVTNVKIIGGDSNAKVTNTTRQLSDKRFIQDIVVDMMGDSTSRGRQALSNTSNVSARGTR